MGELGFLLGLLVLVLVGFKCFFKRVGQETRRAAIRLGFIVEDVERTIPIIDEERRGTTFEKSRVAHYAMRRGGPSGLAWQLLQRAGEGEREADVPAGWQLVVSAGRMPESLRAALLNVARDWKEDYLELEGEPASLHAFWEEWGGKRGAERLRAYFAQIMEAERS